MPLTTRAKYLRKYKPETIYHDFSAEHYAVLGDRGWGYCAGCGAILCVAYSSGVEFLPKKNSEQGHCDSCLGNTGQTREGGKPHRVPMYGFWQQPIFPFIAYSVLKQWDLQSRDMICRGGSAKTYRGKKVEVIMMLPYEEGRTVSKALKKLTNPKDYNAENLLEQYHSRVAQLLEDALKPHNPSTDPYLTTHKAGSRDQWV